MRTQAEIVERIKQAMERDIFGFEWYEYALCLTPESAESLRGIAIKKNADLSNWPYYKTDKDLRDRCIDYMPFAWEKANNCRGVSAWRSLSHYKAWLWLLGQDDFDDIDDYEFYGKDQLRRICDFLGLDPDQWDDGIRVNSEEEITDD
jgi:hypothetical protein